MPSDPESPHIALVDIPGKGKGVVAKEYIRRGALIVSEKPRITLSSKFGDMGILAAARALSEEDIAYMMTFPPTPSDILPPMLSRLKHFLPCVGDDAFGLCPTISRVNHTCYSPKGSPNSTYFWNERTKCEELYAIKDIQEGQELEVSYNSNARSYGPPREHLREIYGFECSCVGCTRPAAEQLASARRIEAYNSFVDRLPARFGRDDPLRILKEIERQILIICEEGYVGEVGQRARDAFQLCAYYGDAASARGWETICRDSHALYQGPTSEWFEKAQSLVTRPESFRGWKQLGARKLKGPSKEVVDWFYPAKVEPVKTAPAVAPSLQASGSEKDAPIDRDVEIVATTTPSAAQKLSKGQKKEARAKAKKDAAKHAVDAENSGGE
ncbi:hypothetical protein C8R47DRAFT_1144610 [Mycena vitilis]|nr:hypothetical protein C8R47DRAFT_1144610 [Mycena vitilis]